jgi:hypothetical protein
LESNIIGIGMQMLIVYVRQQSNFILANSVFSSVTPYSYTPMQNPSNPPEQVLATEEKVRNFFPVDCTAIPFCYVG